MNLISKAWLSSSLLTATLICWQPVALAAGELPEVERLVERRDFKQALVKVNQHLAAQPDSLDGRFYKGVILAEGAETQQAIAIFSQLIKDAPQMLEAYNNLAVLYARQQDYEQARSTLEAALKVDPAFAAVSSNLRNTYGRLAKQAYDKALGQESLNAGGGKSLVMLSQLRMPAPGADKAQEPAAGKPAAQPPAPVSATAAATQPAATPSATAAPAAPEVRKPAAAEPKAQSALASREREVRQAVEAWAEAWMRKDMKAYLAAYASDFKLPGKLSRKEWERERTRRISGKKDSIQLTLDKLDIDVQDGVATVRFLQRYKAGSLSESSNKTLTLLRQGGRWRIKSER